MWELGNMTDFNTLAAVVKTEEPTRYSIPGVGDVIVADHRLKVHEVTPERDRYSPPPPRIRQNVRIDAKDSFVAYLLAFNQGKARLFADIKASKIVAALDYHAAADPGTLDHIARFELMFSEQWARWSSISGKLMSQFEFARFLEENGADLHTPTGADLLEIVRDMYAAKKVDFRSEVRLANGDVAFQWAEETEAKSKTRSGDIEVPSKFVLEIPIYFGEVAVQVYAYLRYRLDDGALKLGIELSRPEFVKQAAFRIIGDEIAAGAGVPVHYGAL